MAVSFRTLLVPMLLGAIGCGKRIEPLYSLDEKPTPAALAGSFDANATGTIRGRVTWHGTLPTATSFRDAKVLPGSFADGYDVFNRLVPRISAKGNGVDDAVIFIRKVDPERSKPWDLPPVRVEMKARLISIAQQGEHLTGFARLGDNFEMVLLDDNAETLRARGATFFTLPFLKANVPTKRPLNKLGIVNLTSAVNNFWNHCYLFVAEHPYFVRTDESGNFTLDQVPDGTYDLVCWMPDWRVERFERDPETLAVARVWFREPLQKSMAVRVEKGQMAAIEFTVGLEDFGK